MAQITIKLPKPDKGEDSIYYFDFCDTIGYDLQDELDALGIEQIKTSKVVGFSDNTITFAINE